MKIAFDSQIFQQQRFGGISRYFCELAKAISKNRSNEVKIIAPMYKNEYISELDSGIVFGYPITSWTHFLGAQKVAASVYQSTIMAYYKPQIIHETYYSSAVAERSNACRILTIYDMIHERLPGHFPVDDDTAKRKAKAARRADHVICISESTKRDAIEILGLDEAKVSVTYLAATDLRQGDHRNQEMKAVGSRPFILYVGLRDGYKNFEGIIKAYAASKILRNFDIICFGGTTFSRAEQEMFASHGLRADSIRHVKGDDQALAVHYQRAEFFVYPSQYEGFGIPPLEAMMQGCAVACSNVSSVPEIVGDSGEYFDPHDFESIRAALETLASDTDRRKQLVSLGYERAKIFSWSRCASDTLELYQSLVAA